MIVLPEKVFDQHIIALGKTGAGKSSAMRYLVEHLLGHDHRVIVITAKSDWWGLKLAADGRHAGYPVPIFGGDHQDMPLHHLSGRTMAELLGTGQRSAVLQMRDFMPAERAQFWIDFSSNLFRLIVGKMFLVIDEVHNFAPKGKTLDVQSAKMLHWSNKLASEARGLGITLIAASQRPAKVHNDFLTSCETLIAMRLTTHWDREAVEAWIKGCGDDKRANEVLNSLAQMKRGDAWAWSPEIEFGPKQIHFPMFSTYDSFKPQEPKEADKLQGWADVDLDDVREKLATVVREQEANDPVKLKTRIRALELELQGKHPVKEADPKAIERAIAATRRECEKAIVAAHTAHKALAANGARFARDLAALAERAAAAFQVELPGIEFPKALPTYPQSAVASGGARTEPTAIGKVHPSASASSNGHKLRAGAERMLAAIAQWSPEGMSEGQMRAHAGLKKSGTFSAYMSDLRTGGYIEERNGLIFSTQDGLDYCQHVPAAPQSTSEVLDIWRPKLRDGARRMLEVIVARGGEPISKEELGSEAGLQKSGTFSAYLSDLKTARLAIVNRDGTVAANRETLFL